MITIDRTGIKELAEEYGKRTSNCRTIGLSKVTPIITNQVSKVFLELMMAGENITLDEQHQEYSNSNRGYYGTLSAGHQMDMINPQEKIDPGGKIMGSGRMYADRFYTMNKDKTAVSLATRAEMQPYPNQSGWKNSPGTGFNLPKMPIMYYMRRGWVDPDYPAHHMKPRPFAEKLALSVYVLRIFASLNDRLLQSWGFKRK